MQEVQVRRVARSVIIVSIVSILYLYFSYDIWGALFSVTNGLWSNAYIFATCILTLGAVLFFYENIFAYVWLRLSASLFLETFSYVVMSSIPFLVATFFLDKYYYENFVVVFILLALGIMLLIVGVVRSLRLKLVEASVQYDLFGEITNEEIEPTDGQSIAIKALEDLLANFGAHEDIGPLSVVVNGKWGDGKTTIVDRVLKTIDQKQFFVVRFDPWRYTSQESLVSGFYDKIGEEVANRLPGFSMARVDMARFAKGFVSSISKSGFINSLLLNIPDRTVNFPGKIDSQLRLYNKRLLVVIDDVERLYEDAHIIRTLQLTQYLKSDIHNSAILFLADLQQIRAAIPERLNSSTYMQKFFDTTVAVVPPTRSEMLAFTNIFLKRQNYGFDLNLQEDVQLSKLMRNIRGIKRVLTMVYSDIDAVGENVNIQDILFLRTIYYAYPALYIDIRENIRLYFDYTFDYNDSDFQIYGFSEEKFEETQRTHFEELFAELKLTDENVLSIKSLLEKYIPSLENVFRDKGTGKRVVDRTSLSRDRRIGYRDYLERYFILSKNVDEKHRVERTVDDFISKYWSQGETTRFSAFKKLYSSKLKDDKQLFFEIYLQKIADIRGDSQDDENVKQKQYYRDVLRLNVLETEYIMRDEDRTLIKVLGGIDQYAVEGDLGYILQDLAKFITHPSVGLRVILYMNPKRNSGFYRLKHYEGYDLLRTSILKNIDTYYISRGNNVLTEVASENKEWTFIVAQWSTSVCYDTPDDFIPERFEKVNKYLLKIIRDDHKLLRQLVQDAFWLNDLMQNKYRYNFKVTPQAYKYEIFVYQAKIWVKKDKKNPILEDDERQELTSFIEAFEQFQKEEIQKTKNADIIKE